MAGITDLHNHVVDGAVEGHCDCMFFVNTYRWDYPLVAALVAPRPLLLVNTDSDTIFPLDGVMRIHARSSGIYALHHASRPTCGLVIGPGPHKDTQNLQVPVFRWFNRHLKGEDPVIDMAAVKFFTPRATQGVRRPPGGRDQYQHPRALRGPGRGARAARIGGRLEATAGRLDGRRSPRESSPAGRANRGR